VAAGPWVLTAGCTSTVEGVVTNVGDPYGQTLQAYQIAIAAAERAGASVADVVRTRTYLVDPAHVEAAGRAHAELFGAVRPVTTLVIVARLIDPQLLVEVELEAYRS
jgi:enamine deaminase RidA (YjgF/YER057c/UK114 family)